MEIHPTGWGITAVEDCNVSWIPTVLTEAWNLFYLAAPFILFGLLMAGVLQILLSPSRILRWMGQSGLSAVVRAALLGIPLPLCSCSVLPTAIALHRRGASEPATASFLITTPETNIAALILTWGLLGPLMAIFRPLASFLTGTLAGILSIASTSDEEGGAPHTGAAAQPPECGCRIDEASHLDQNPEDFVGFRQFRLSFKRWLRSLFLEFPQKSSGAPIKSKPEESVVPFPAILHSIGRYAFTRALDDIAFYLIIGLLLAGVLGALFPADLAERGAGSQLLTMIVVLLIAVPMYTCSSGSTPVAAALVAAGFSPGTALVLLLAGPAVSIVSILVVANHFGRRFLKIYLISVILGTLAWGLALDALLRVTGLTISASLAPPAGGLTALLHFLCVVLLAALLVWRLWAGAAREPLSQMRGNFISIREHPGTQSAIASIRAHKIPIRRAMIGGSLILGILIYGLTGFKSVPPDSMGFGRVFNKVTRKNLAPGLHWALPAPFGGIDVWRVNYPRKTDVGYRTDLEMIANRRELRSQSPPDVWHSPVAAMNSDPTVASYLSGDENLFEMSFSVHYFLSDPYNYFYELDKSLDLVNLYAQAVAREIIGSSLLDSLLTSDRSHVELYIRDNLQTHLTHLKTGIRIVSIHLIDIHPPQEAVHAFRDVSSAREDRQTFIHEAYVVTEREIPIARGQSKVEIAEVEAVSLAATAEAKGKAIGYIAQVEAYQRHPAILRDLLWLETSESVLAGRQKFIVPPGTQGHGVILWKLPATLPAPSGN
ncbi:MAG: SO_0444 family Cu/Zn efflux transporter [Candidatus Eisenbacteria bacterium]|uniref:SO_0444 family Cu/Zn efflux transporter n=1 Tax=Eiseniibacteriota bacterium TaxID=2212470 RepID=A0A948S3L9_UNCEI|nr:SO_0444 family Cu/Zn efflux transporter [Candidatus Eisenbacteria bacterium]MBU1950339.1 SO_0444 family Cu/Zn efflux transporter [Candidatus Eisenbacteria bacterium]MBU2693199.1 SO_0444 family Cu/Zn efflux transporter [Candidatus Eisenbacteria bacterium]